MTPHASSALVALVAIGLYVAADGLRDSPDGRRYCSGGAAQPSPFSRRFHAWPPKLLTASTYAAIVLLAASFGDPKKAALFVALPGVWFLATRPRCVDAVAMALAWASSLALSNGHPWSLAASVAFALVGGFVHERAPVYAAVYALSPWPLIGLLAVGWWRKKAPPPPQPPLRAEASLLERIIARANTGRGSEGGLRSAELLDWRTNVLPLRGVLFLGAWHGASPAAWGALALAYAGRLIATDPGRALLWAAPPLIASSGDAPAWFLAAHLVTFQRIP